MSNQSDYEKAEATAARILDIADEYLYVNVPLKELKSQFLIEVSREFLRLANEVERLKRKVLIKEIE